MPKLFSGDRPHISRAQILRHALPTAVLMCVGVLVVVFAQVGGASASQSQGSTYVPPCSPSTSTITLLQPGLAAMELGNHRIVTVTKWKTQTRTVTKAVTKTKTVCRTATVTEPGTTTATTVTATEPGKTETVTTTSTVTASGATEVRTVTVTVTTGSTTETF